MVGCGGMTRVAILVLIMLLAVVARADGIFAYGIPSFGQTSSTVAALPNCTAALTGLIYTVTDALGPALNILVVGGGAVTVLVHCNGTVWVVG
jgi:hypothetical protein